MEEEDKVVSLREENAGDRWRQMIHAVAIPEGNSQKEKSLILQYEMMS